MREPLLAVSLAFIVYSSCAQTIIKRDPEIKRMVDEISGERIEQYIRKLVSFHKRHNLSEQDNPSKGIGAAWNWIKTEMETSIPASEGRLTVRFEEYTACRFIRSRKLISFPGPGQKKACN
jgi:hypothetical protein